MFSLKNQPAIKLNNFCDYLTFIENLLPGKYLLMVIKQSEYSDKQNAVCCSGIFQLSISEPSILKQNGSAGLIPDTVGGSPGYYSPHPAARSFIVNSQDNQDGEIRMKKFRTENGKGYYRLISRHKKRGKNLKSFPPFL